jgi:hypothetical protein
MAIAQTAPSAAVISWSAAFTGYTLQQNLNLATTNWTGMTNSPMPVSGRNEVGLSPLTGTRYYRLIGP